MPTRYPSTPLSYTGASKFLGTRKLRSMGWGGLTLTREPEGEILVRRRSSTGFVLGQLRPDSSIILGEGLATTPMAYKLAFSMVAAYGYFLAPGESPAFSRREAAGAWWTIRKPSVWTATVEDLPMFVDGLRWTADGPPDLPLAKEKAVGAVGLFQALTTNYANRCYTLAAQPGGITYPSMEGCPLCYETATNLRLGRGDEPYGVGHLQAHLLSKDVEPCLVYRALLEGGRRPASAWAEIMRTPTTVSKAVYYFWRRRQRSLVARLSIGETKT